MQLLECLRIDHRVLSDQAGMQSSYLFPGFISHHFSFFCSAGLDQGDASSRRAGGWGGAVLNMHPDYRVFHKSVFSYLRIFIFYEPP